MSLALLIVLIASHYLADFQLTTAEMIAAKTHGEPLMPILNHAAIHATLIILCLLAFSQPWLQVWILGFTELITHFMIDLLKGRLTKRYTILADNSKKPFWQLYGIDQMLHLLVIVGIWYAAITL